MSHAPMEVQAESVPRSRFNCAVTTRSTGTYRSPDRALPWPGQDRIPLHRTMAEPYSRNFDQPDEVVEVEKVRSEVISLNGMTLAHDVQQPGWRWAEHIRPLVGTEWCESRHVR